jgi:hypothetical protein
LVGLIIYSLAFNIYFAIFKINSQAQVLNFGIGVRVLYNLVLAMALYFIFKNLFKIHENGRQLSLFTS